MMRILAALAILTACNEHGSPGRMPDSGVVVGFPDASGDPGCGSVVSCGTSRHCEDRCQPPMTDGCANDCHVTCVPNIPCANIPCAPGTKCIETCSDDCQGMAWLCQQRCEPETSTVCELLHSEQECAARSDCVPVFVGGACSCMGVLCSCGQPAASFVLCRTR